MRRKSDYLKYHIEVNSIKILMIILYFQLSYLKLYTSCHRWQRTPAVIEVHDKSVA